MIQMHSTLVPAEDLFDTLGHFDDEYTRALEAEADEQAEDAGPFGFSRMGS